jgi:putative membrane protein
MVSVISPDEGERLRGAVQAAEESTAGDIRLSIVRKSVRFPVFFFVLATLVAGMALYVGRRRAQWGHPSETDLALCAGAGAAVGSLLAWIRSRLGVGRAVHRHAEREFVRLGIARTSGRTGVLLFLSLAERRAVLLADQGIHAKVEEGTWDRILLPLLSALKEGKRTDALVEAIGQIGQVLSKHLPRSPGNRHQLPDDIALDG